MFTIHALQLGWLCFGFGLFTGISLTLIVKGIVKLIDEEGK